MALAASSSDLDACVRGLILAPCLLPLAQSQPYSQSPPPTSSRSAGMQRPVECCPTWPGVCAVHASSRTHAMPVVSTALCSAFRLCLLTTAIHPSAHLRGGDSLEKPPCAMRVSPSPALANTTCHSLNCFRVPNLLSPSPSAPIPSDIPQSSDSSDITSTCTEPYPGALRSSCGRSAGSYDAHPPRVRGIVFYHYVLSGPAATGPARTSPFSRSTYEAGHTTAHTQHNDASPARAPPLTSFSLFSVRQQMHMSAGGAHCIRSCLSIPGLH